MAQSIRTVAGARAIRSSRRRRSSTKGPNGSTEAARAPSTRPADQRCRRAASKIAATKRTNSRPCAQPTTRTIPGMPARVPSAAWRRRAAAGRRCLQENRPPAGVPAIPSSCDYRSPGRVNWAIVSARRERETRPNCRGTISRTHPPRDRRRSSDRARRLEVRDCAASGHRGAGGGRGWR